MEWGAALIGVIGTLAGAALGAIIAYHFSLKIAETQAIHANALAKINAQRIAGAKLRATFAPVIANFNIDRQKREHPGSDELFRTTLPGISAAIEEYRCFISPKRPGRISESMAKLL